MPSPFRAGARVALDRPRVLGLAALAVAVETALRLALGLLHPVLFVVWPPVVAVGLFGAAAPALRQAAATPDRPPDWRLGDRLRTHGPRLLVVVTVCHAAALAAGTALFLLVDTPVRYGLYAAGHGPLSLVVVYTAPLAGVAAGTILAWGVLAPAVARVADGEAAAVGDGPGDPGTTLAARRTAVDVGATLAALRTAVDVGATLAALRTAVEVAVASPRRTAGVLACHAVAAVALGGAVLTGAVYAGRAAAVVPLVLVGGGVGALVATLALTSLFPVHAALAAAAPEPPPVPFGRLALASLVVCGLVAGAGAVRVSETRPTAGAASLPADPSAAYATALENTEAVGHDVETCALGASLTVTRRLDRRDRQYLTTWEEADGDRFVLYADAGVGYGTRGATGPSSPVALGSRTVDGASATALPAYWRYAAGDYRLTGDFGLPRPGTGEWTVVDREDGRRTLELRDSDAVFAALYERRPRDETVRYEAARVRVRVDEGRGVVTGGSARLNATVDGSTVSTRLRYDVRAGDGVDLHRPAALGPRTPGEWVWTLFAY